MNVRALFVALSLLVAGCGHSDGAASLLEIVGAPACPNGESYYPPIVIKIDKYGLQHGLSIGPGGKVEPWDVTGWSDGPVDIQIGTCAVAGKTADCGHPAWQTASKALVNKVEAHLSLSLPKFTAACAGGTQVSN